MSQAKLPRRILNIKQSSLFRLGRKKDVADLLTLKVHDLKALSADSNYKEWINKQNGKKERIIEEPLPKLASTLKKLQSILSRVETPIWLLSGKKGIKPRKNAEIHRQNRYMINVDIDSFYQSTKREFVYLSLKNIFQQIDDVASIIADLVTYKGHIPTGASTSQLMAFWAYRPMFERIHKLCVLKNITMTVWVDDITFSSREPFPKNWISDISKIATEVGLSLKPSKTKKYTAKEYKTITGSVISPTGEILVKNAKRKEIIEILRGKKIEDLSLNEARTLLGKVTSQRQNQSDFCINVYLRCKNHLRHLEKQERRTAKT